MRAVLALDGVDFKKHSAVIAAFVKDYLKTEIISREFSNLIFSASLIRNHSDYDDFYVCSKKETENLIAGAEQFYNAVRNSLAERYK